MLHVRNVIKRINALIKKRTKLVADLNLKIIRL